MSDKKHIDRIFQEKLKDFEVSPNPELWNNIQGQMNLEKEEPKKAFPLWLRLAGVAALLVILFTAGTWMFDGNNPSTLLEQNTVDTNAPDTFDNDSKNVNDSETSSSSRSIDNNSETPIANTNSETDFTKEDSKNLTSGDNVANSTTEANQAPKTNGSNLKNTSLNTVSSSEYPESKVAHVESGESTSKNQKNNVYGSVNNTPLNSSQITESNKNVVTSNSTKVLEDNNTTQIADNTSPKNPSKSNGRNTLDSSTDNPVSSNPNAVNSSIVQSSSTPELDANAVEKALETEKTQEAVALNAMKGDTPHNEKEKEDNQKVGDSLATGELPSIEEEIAQLDNISEKEEEKEELVNRWQVAANVAPVYYNSLGKGSHIDDQFVSNSKTGEVNMSYGVNVSYALSKKLSVRSGVNSLNLSYDTDNVILYETPGGNNTPPVNPLRNINLTPQYQTLNAFSANNLGVQQINDVLYNAAISQRLSYYEVPVELEYKLINNRFGLNIIGGVSTFFLDDNEVYSEFEEYTTYIGEANNINNVSFSTNLGLGINYKFSDAFKFNLEPTFKYQLNGYNNTSGNFRPYIIGVYTGFSYKF